jgi:hypothetical protein
VRSDLVSIAFAAALLLAGPAAADVHAILQANRAATGNQPAQGTLDTLYSYAGQGMSGQTRSIADLATGRFIDSFAIGPIRGASGYDGRTPWQTDSGGGSTPQRGGDRLMLAINEAYRDGNLWWQPDFGGAKVDFVGRDAGGDHLRFAPRGGKAFDIWFDATTHLVTHVRELQGFSVVDTEYRDYVQRHGMRVPGEALSYSDGDKSDPQTAKLISAEVRPVRPVSAYAMPANHFADWSIAGGMHQVTLPFRLFNNHIIVEAVIDGRGPIPILIDTGGHSIVTSSTVEALNLDSQGAATAGGAGESTQTAGYTKVDSIALGGMTLRHQTVLTMDFAPVEVEGIKLGGMLGSELFQRFVIRIDYGASTLTLIDPAHFKPTSGDGVAIRFDFYDHIAQLHGAVAGRPARLDIDTGSGAQISLTKPYVEAQKLRAAFPNGILTVDGWGVGGPVKSYDAMLPSLALGPVVTSDVVAGLTTQDKGSFSDAYLDGNVGTGFLKRFVVTFDYGRRFLYLRRLAHPLPDTGTFDRAGMWLNLAKDGFQIMSVADGGPAAAAKLAPGDVVTQIGDRPSTGMTLDEARRTFRIATAGTPIAIVYRRDGSIARTSVTPRILVR